MGALDETTPPLGAGAASGTTDPAMLNWQRWEYVKMRGHNNFTYNAARCENFYFGGSTTGWGHTPQGRVYEYMGTGQWTQEGWFELNTIGRPTYTINEIKPGINAAIGYQIHNRLDVSYRPRGGIADTDSAALQSKITMQILDQNKYHWLETQMFADGLIEQRGYLDIRMDFNSNIYGEVCISLLDPRDVAPDPDAKTYDPKGWSDVTQSCWYTADNIEERYGKTARALAEKIPENDGDFGRTEDQAPRNSFGLLLSSSLLDYYRDDDEGLRRYRVIDRQRWVFELTQVAVYPSGDVEPIPDATPEQITGYKAQGAVILKRMHRRVKWTVTTRWATLHDDFSPYDRFTVVPYYCYFRRGRTAGKVDDAIDPQIMLNKAMSGFVHIINTTANSGWIVEQNSLSNMTTAQLEQKGSMTGLILEYKVKTTPPVKIQPNTVPPGVDKVIDRAYFAIKSATVPDAMRGGQGQEISGVAIQSREFASQQELAMPLDNLTHTRELVADFVTYLKQTYYDYYRVWRITETDPRTSREVTNEYRVNEYNELTGQFDNDLTAGKYDTVVDSVPMQVTFNNTQFTQAMEMKKNGVNIPDPSIIKNSNLSDKADIIEQIRDQKPPTSPLDEARATLAQAQTAESQARAALVQSQAVLADVNAANIRMTTLFAGTQAAAIIAGSPETAPLADALAGSVGFKDQNAPPVVPSPPAGMVPAGGPPQIPQDTHPLTPISPASPAVGADAGIEGGNSAPIPVPAP